MSNKPITVQTDVMFLLQVLENEIFKFEENICDFEEDLNGGSNIPEDVRDTILTVIGMAKLLMAQKLTQFRELCYKNIVSWDWERSVVKQQAGCRGQNRNNSEF